ncbi:EcsC family protein [Oceanobacillus halotolerans]|uniref:EcsC family protein n=1 Tax=Oceanobacillus halotolerans TaxID=2663380 RepID=UPI0013DC59B1|nr:EcsC family protein [Oceanobacillus halotolerans]
MNEYEEKVYKELKLWRKKVLKDASMFQKLSKKAQTKVNGMIPDKAHTIITEAIRNMVKMTLVGSNLTTKKQQAMGKILYDRDELAKEKLTAYRKTATVEGAGTGAGGIFLGLADFPMLLTIKIKFLFEVASIYGCDTNRYEERLFILHVFQLAFSPDTKRKETFSIIENWDHEKEHLVELDWREFQQNYRDYIDLIKMLQLVPGFGAIVGAYANHNLLDTLGETAMNAYRMRYFNSILDK